MVVFYGLLKQNKEFASALKIMAPRYRSLSSWLRELFSQPVRKISVDAGLGCPNRDGSVGFGGCIYCNSTGSGTGAARNGLSVSDQVDRGIEFLARRYRVSKFIAYFQSYTNTYGTPEYLRQIYLAAIQRPEVVGLAIGTRPDCLSDRVLDVICEMSNLKLVWIEIGLQSSHDRTLDLINRGHSARDFFEASRRAMNRGVLVVAHIILGLPGESLEDMLITAKALSSAGIHGVKIHPLYVISGTPLEELYRSGGYTPMTLAESVEAILSVIQVLPKDMVIHRLTSDPHKDELVAPRWMLDKTAVRNFLNHQMEKRNIFQGSKALAQ
ncbi:MAG: TIGR01212 family radical SAM protein [Pseudomonadota bacterium]